MTTITVPATSKRGPLALILFSPGKPLEDSSGQTFYFRHILAFSIAVASVPGTIVSTSASSAALRSDGRRQPASPIAGSARAAYFRLPLRFEPANREAGDAFVARGAGYAVSLSPSGAALLLEDRSRHGQRTLTMSLTGGDRHVHANARRPLAGVSNYLMGNDPERWVTGVRGYGEIEYRGVYRGVDIVYYGNQQKLEYDFIVAPGASHDSIALAFDGANRVSVNAGGDLVISTGGGDLVQHRPEIYQNDGGARRPIPGGYVIRRDGTIGFRVGKYDRRLPLVIDPVLSYASYLGGTKTDRGHAVAVDAAGNVFVAGETTSADFPVVNAIQPQRNGFGDAFVAKLDPSGDTLVYSTFFGGSSFEGARDIAVDEAGTAYAAGYTESWDFPAAHNIGPLGRSDAFVIKLNPAGTLEYATRIGGVAEDESQGIAVDAQGRAHVAGRTFSAEFPVVNPWQGAPGGSPAFRSRDGGRTWSGLNGKLRATAVDAFAFDPSQAGTVYAGTMTEGLFRTIDDGETWTRANVPAQQFFAFAVQRGPQETVFAAGQGGLYRSRDHGENWTVDPTHPWATALAVTGDSPSVVYSAMDFPTRVLRSADSGDTWTDTGLTAPVQFLAASGSTVYAATTNTVFKSVGGGAWVQVNGSSHADVVYGTITALAVDPANPQVAYVGTSQDLFKTTTGGSAWTPMFGFGPWTAIAFAPSDPATVFAAVSTSAAISHDGGQTWSAINVGNDALLITAAFDPADSARMYAGSFLNADAFVATLSADGSTLEYSTFLGGTRSDAATDIAVDPNGNLYITGDTQSLDFPTLHPIQSAFGGLSDVFVVKIASSGEPLYATYLGGGHSDYQSRIAADAAGRAYVTGITLSTNFPVANPWQASHGGGFSDIFVTALNESGSAFVYSTFLGGSGMENDPSQSLGPAIAVTSGGDVTVAGNTQSTNFPVTPDAWHRTHAGGTSDVFVSRLDAAGALQYSTYLGGAGADNARGIALDSGGTAVVAGYTDSTDWATPTAVQPTYAGFDDAFVVKISPEAAAPDATPPATTISLSGTEGVPGWYKSPVTVSLSAVDNDHGRGVASIEYLVTGSIFKRYTAPFTISSSGATKITVRATDWAGNVENPMPSTTVMIDTQAPVASSQIQGTIGLAGWFKSPVNVTLFFVDIPPGTGVTSREYRVGDAPFANYTAPFVVSAEGMTPLSARATDANGNVGTMSRTIAIDTSAPRTNIGVSGTPGAMGWYKSPVTVTLSGSDDEPGSGVGAIDYRLNDGPFQRYSAPFTLTTAGMTRITARATDRAGNVDPAPPTTTVMMDTAAPKTTAAFSGTPGQGGWYTSAVTVALAATDNPQGSGVASLEFSVNGAAFQSYTTPITLSAQGMTQLTVRATDAAGNVENPLPSFPVMIDSSGPVVTIASPEARDYQHSENLVVSFLAVDNASGVQSMSAMIDSVPVQNAQSISLLSLALGVHTVEAFASDVAGNSAWRSMSFRIVATIDSLIAIVNIYDAQGKITSNEKNLLAKLNDAKAALARGSTSAASGKLRDFIEQCRAQSGHGISADAAAVLIADAESVLATF